MRGLVPTSSATTKLPLHPDFGEVDKDDFKELRERYRNSKAVSGDREVDGLISSNFCRLEDQASTPLREF